jgi:predicted amidohydrolase
MILGLYQCASPAGDIAAGLAVIDDALGKAAAAGVEMLTMPELFLPGYNSTTSTPPDGWEGVEGKVAALAAKHGVALCIGLAEYEGGTAYNSAFVYGDDGAELARFRKIQLFGPGEQSIFAFGDKHSTFTYRGHKFGILICYDVEFPEHTRALARAGVQTIIVPTANMKPFINVNQITVPARALESRLNIVYANYTGVEGDLDYVGHSAIFAPDGYLLGGKGFGEGLAVAEATDQPGENGIPLSTQFEDYRPVEPPK